MKIRINKKYLNKIKLFKSNIFLKKSIEEDLKNIYNYKQITLYHNLQKISGINSSTALNFLSFSGISPKNTIKGLKKNISLVTSRLENNLNTLNLDLNLKVLQKRRSKVFKKINLMSLTGIRHKNNLPVRGQRTSTNARTRKKFRIV